FSGEDRDCLLQKFQGSRYISLVVQRQCVSIVSFVDALGFSANVLEFVEERRFRLGGVPVTVNESDGVQVGKSLPGKISVVNLQVPHVETDAGSHATLFPTAAQR